VLEICRKVGISQATCFNWWKKYVCLLPDELWLLKALVDGEPSTDIGSRELASGRLKQIVADLTLEREMLQDVIR
jgi:putative transposase